MQEPQRDTIVIREIADTLDDQSLTGRTIEVSVEAMRAVDRYLAMHGQAQGELRMTAEAIERYGLEPADP